MLYAAAADSNISVRLYQTTITANSATGPSVRARGGLGCPAVAVTSVQAVHPQLTPAHLRRFYSSNSLPVLSQANAGVAFIGSNGIGFFSLIFDQCNVTGNFAASSSPKMVRSDVTGSLGIS